jgi:hypothetical protein
MAKMHGKYGPSHRGSADPIEEIFGTGKTIHHTGFKTERLTYPGEVESPGRKIERLSNVIKNLEAAKAKAHAKVVTARERVGVGKVKLAKLAFELANSQRRANPSSDELHAAAKAKLEEYHNIHTQVTLDRFRQNPKLEARVARRAEATVAKARAEEAERMKDPEYRRQKAEMKDSKLRQASRDAAQRLGQTTMINASGHEVKLPDGPYMYHRDQQKAALELAKGLKGSDRKFALELAKRSGQEKRKFISPGTGHGAGQPRVPAGHPDGGQWTKK